MHDEIGNRSVCLSLQNFWVYDICAEKGLIGEGVYMIFLFAKRGGRVLNRAVTVFQMRELK